MSSAKYVAELRPDPWLRRVVLLTTVLAGVAGIVVLLGLPINTLTRVLAIVGWAGWLVWNGIQRRTAERQMLRIRLFPDGTAALLRPDGNWSSARVAPGSAVLAEMAWLVISPATGPVHTELLRGRSRESKDWRRLQVIWRHHKIGSGGALGSSS